jgi:quercetin dioxygenase-like cupin family protein
MKRHLNLLSAGAVVAGALVFTPALATPPDGLTAEQLGKSGQDPFDVNVASIDQAQKWDLKLNSKSESDVYIMRNTIAPGGNLGWHSHPGPTIVTVTQGSVLLHDGMDPLCSSTVYNVGEGFTEIGAGHHVHNLTNASASQPAQVIAVHFVPSGELRRIDEPEPNNCKF